MRIFKKASEFSAELESLRERYASRTLPLIAKHIPVDSDQLPFRDRPHQEFLFYTFLDQEADVAGVLPTNSGKSLIYQAGSEYVAKNSSNHGKTIVVSPLISLMIDQVTKSSTDEERVLRQKLREGIVVLNSRTTKDHPGYVERALKVMRSGAFHLAYVAPERFRSAKFMKIYESQPIQRFVIDEMHCVTLWGTGFRYEYKNLASVLARHDSKLMLLTATSSDERIENTFSRLRSGTGRRTFVVVRSEIRRPELIIGKPLKVRDQSSRATKTVPLVRKAIQSGPKAKVLVFTAFVKNQDARKTIWDCGTLVEYYKTNADRMGLKSHQIAGYHAQMELEERSEVQSRFLTGKLRLIVATKAFGMGVNMPGIRGVIHVYPPVTIEEYYQEIGRGGRDATTSDPCRCDLFWSSEDTGLLSGLIGGYWDYRLLECFFLLAHGTLLVNQEDRKLSKRFYESILPELRSDGLLKKDRSIRRAGYLIERYRIPNVRARRELLERLFDLGKSTKYVRRFRRWLHLHDEMRSGMLSVPTTKIKRGVEVNHIKEYMSVFEDHGWVERERTDGKHGETSYWISKDALSVQEIQEFCDARRADEDAKRVAWDAMLGLCRSSNPWQVLKRRL